MDVFQSRAEFHRGKDAISQQMIYFRFKLIMEGDLHTPIQGRHQGLTARTESGGPGLMGACRGARDLGKKAMVAGRKGKEGKKKERKKRRKKRVKKV